MFAFFTMINLYKEELVPEDRFLMKFKTFGILLLDSIETNSNE